MSWNARGRPSSSSARVSPSSTNGAAGQRPHLRDQLGHAGGDLAQGAGPDPDVVAVAVHLDAGAVELVLDGDVGAEAGERGVERIAGGGEHRPDRPADLQGDGRERGLAAVEGEAGGLGQAPGEHERAAHDGGGDLGGRRDRLQHHALQRAVAQLAAEQRGEEALLVAGGGGEQAVQQLGPPLRRARARGGGERVERGVDVARR